MVKTEYGDTNIFNMTAPQEYRCQILHYHNKLSRLYVSVFKGEQKQIPVLHFLFSDVAYFDCPVSWQGTDFAIASQDDCIELLLDAGLIGPAILRFPRAYASITDHAKLYVGTTSADRDVRIVANSASLLQTPPSNI